MASLGHRARAYLEHTRGNDLARQRGSAVEKARRTGV
jgi:hypothetical protein